MKLFVDDIRACPEGWVLARTVTEAIRILAGPIRVDDVSLDHDITCTILAEEKEFYPHRYHRSRETFEPVAHYLALMKKEYEKVDVHPHDFDEWPVKVTFHTGNIEAGRKMAKILDMDYEFRDYPGDFIEGSCHCVEHLPGEVERCDHCKAYYHLVGKWPGEHGEELR